MTEKIVRYKKIPDLTIKRDQFSVVENIFLPLGIFIRSSL
jgi:hypothetical protein